MRNRTYMNVKTQFENVGDALIIRELLSLISARSELVVVTSRCPKVFRTAIGIDRLENGKASEAGFLSIVLSMIGDRLRGKRSYYFLIPGGINGERTFKQYIVGQLNNVALVFLKWLGVRVCQLGISYERLGPRHVSLLRARTRLLHRALVRDEISLGYAHNLNIRADGVVPDLAFNLRPFTMQTGERDAVFFSFRADKLAAGRGHVTNAVVRICSFVPADKRLVFMAQVERDRDFALALKSAVEDRLGRVGEYVEEYSSIEACRATFSQGTHLFSNRLHALLLALGSGVKPVPVIDRSIDAKIDGTFRLMRQEGLILDLAAIDDQAVREALEAPFAYSWDRERSRLQECFATLYT